jgi:uncharacterized protein (TIGR02679 family)
VTDRPAGHDPLDRPVPPAGADQGRLMAEPRSPLLDPALAPLWQAVHARLSSGRPVGTIRSGQLDESGRAALADLLGLSRFPGPVPKVPLDRLELAVRAIAGTDIRTFVERTVGPIPDRAADRAAAAAARAELWAWLFDHEALRAQPALREWAETIRRAGTSSLPRTRALLEQALLVLTHLPADGRPLPTVATEVLGDPHALDDGTPLAALVHRAMACLLDTPPPTNAEQRRALWERVGVTGDQLSVTVLTAGLRPAGQDLVSRLCRLSAAEGHATSLTLAQLRAAGTLAVEAGTAVHAVENPSVLALALARFGPTCPPLLCTSGWPNSAAIRLLRMLGGAGAAVRYHGDLDGEGVRIAAYVIAKTAATPWRMSAIDYRAAVRETGRPAGRVTDAPWDAELGPLMRDLGVAVFEEQVADQLLEDMATGNSDTSG